MTVLSYAQLEGLWLASAKGTKYATHTWAALMAAIAEAESGGNTDALNPTDNNGTQSSFGLWQISNGTHTPPASNWADPAENAKLAIGKLQGQGLSAWGTYDSGAYKAYLNNSTTPDTNVAGNPGAQQAQLTAAQGNTCAFGISAGLPALPIPLIGGGLLPIGGGNISACVLSKSQARAVLAIAVLASGAVVGMVGLALTAVWSAPGRKILTTVMPQLKVAAAYLGTNTSKAGPKIEAAPKTGAPKAGLPAGATPPPSRQQQQAAARQARVQQRAQAQAQGADIKGAEARTEVVS